MLQSSNRDLVNIKGLTEAKIDKIREAAKKLDCRGGSFKTGLEVWCWCVIAEVVSSALTH